MDLNTESIRKLIEVMDKHQLVEISYEEGDKKVHLRRRDDKTATTPLGPINHTVAGEKSLSPADVTRHEIKSPLVGTFYRSSKPDTEVFVDIGEPVTPDKTVCIIEAMKVMNEIKAECEGVIKEIKAKNGESIEFGQTLFIVQPKSAPAGQVKPL